MTDPPALISEGHVIVVNPPSCHGVPVYLGFKQRPAGACVITIRNWVADAARIHDPQPPTEAPVQRPMRVSGQDELGVGAAQQSTELIVAPTRNQGRLVVSPMRAVDAEHPGPIGQLEARLERQRRKPIEPSGTGHQTLRPGKRVRHFQAEGLDLRLAPPRLEPRGSIPGHDVAFPIPANDTRILEAGQPFEHTDRIRSDRGEIAEHDVAVDATDRLDISQNSVERYRVAVDVTEDREPYVENSPIAIRSRPCTYGRRTVGMTSEPSACW